jgi:hypothetical protein
MLEERYAVVSCHVERLLDDRAWRRLSRLQERAPGGFRVAALVRPPGDGEDRGRGLERAREAAARGPLGHHTHWGGPGHARPIDGDPAERVRREAGWLRESGLRPTVFCGGGWYLDEAVAAIVAEVGYADCTATAFRPSYLAEDAPSATISDPCWLELPGGLRLLELPTTHSLGMLVRALGRRRALVEPLVHVYFHDTDFVDRRRWTALELALRFLARRRVPADLDRVASEAREADLAVRRVFGP